MATINRENIGVLNDRISVKVDRGDYFPHFEKELKQLSKSVNLPGFRKGMVPVGLVKKMHGQTVFTQEVIKSVEKELSNYLQNEKLNLFSRPLPENIDSVQVDMNNPTEYKFDFEIGLKPDFEIIPLNNGSFNFTRYAVKAEEKDIDEEIKRLQKKAGERREKEEITTEEDILKVRFQPSDETGKVIENSEVREEQILVSYFAPKFSKQLTGRKKGDTQTLKLSDAFEDKELAYILKDWKLEGKEGAADEYYVMTIEQIEELIPKELTEDLFNEVYPGSGILTEEALRDRIRQDYEAYFTNEANHLLDHEIFEKLVHETPIELPEDFLKRWMKQEGEQPKTDEEVAEAYPSFDHETRWNLISSKIINENDLSVSPEELQQNFRERLMGYFGMKEGDAADNEKINDFVANMMKNEKTVEETYRNLLTNKLFDWLRNKATIVEKEVTADEFSKLSHNHHHHEH
jgi:trigger factor